MGLWRLMGRSLDELWSILGKHFFAVKKKLSFYQYRVPGTRTVDMVKYAKNPGIYGYQLPGTMVPSASGIYKGTGTWYSFLHRIYRVIPRYTRYTRYPYY